MVTRPREKQILGTESFRCMVFPVVGQHAYIMSRVTGADNT